MGSTTFAPSVWRPRMWSLAEYVFSAVLELLTEWLLEIVKGDNE
jgi:hypothetical protein